ncbi:glucosaminidase domain-containing protein, partial [uncultured Anaerovibrio sp.]|uniref:glucosaminidase domain-containing protein n=1 Tax=uncultured Anaerovibrio sp. TaxID=361586 RepID=UPI00344957A8
TLTAGEHISQLVETLIGRFFFLKKKNLNNGVIMTMTMVMLLGLHGSYAGAKGLSSYRPVITWEKMSALDAVTLFGPATVSQEQMVKFIRSRSPEPKLNCSLEELVGYYYTEGDIEGIRPDVALCQALKETDFFRYGNDVNYNQNNYCGLGATGNKAPGNSFLTPQRGVRAHIQHLIAYGSKKKPKQEIIDPRFDYLVEHYPQYHGVAVYWPDLNGRWAVPGTTYGQEILKLWRQAQNENYETSQLKLDLQEAESKPNDASAWQRVYLTARQAGNYKVATKACAKLTELDNRDVVAFIHWGDILREWGKNEEALAAYDKALELRPKKYQALMGKAYLLAIMGENQQAAEVYEKILAGKADHSLALYNHGCLMAALGNYEQAVSELRQVVGQMPDNSDVRASLTEAEQLLAENTQK